MVARWPCAPKVCLLACQVIASDNSITTSHIGVESSDKKLGNMSFTRLDTAYLTSLTIKSCGVASKQCDDETDNRDKTVTRRHPRLIDSPPLVPVFDDKSFIIQT